MPELPEVETIRLGLERFLVGDSIEDIEIRYKNLFIGDPEKVKNSKVIGVRRFGKGLVIDFDNDMSLAIHVKMTGQLIYIGAKIPKSNKISEKAGGTLPHIHTHVVFKLRSGEDKATLYYSDIRRFGWLKVLETAKLFEESFFKNLGPEPFKELNLDKFREVLGKKKTVIKALLMDQSQISGVGNIYANDALYLAKIDPRRSANSLKASEVELLFESLEAVLRKGLEVGGASEWQYVNVTGETGGYQNFFKVYGKVGKKCSECGSIIEKITIGGRGTFYCPNCQR